MATKTFIRGGYSFRPSEPIGGRPAWHVYRKGDSRFSFVQAELMQSTDGACWLFHLAMTRPDARISFDAACDLVMACLPIE